MKKIVNCSKISVDCVHNDPVDIRCGGAEFLGFDFFIKTKDEDKIIKFIKETLNELNIPLMNIYVAERNLKLSNTAVWSKTNITRHILKDAEMLISESKRYYNQGDKVKKHNKDIIKISDECNALAEYAKMYIKENRKLTSNIDKEVRDAVLIDSINYFGLLNGCDCLLTTQDLYTTKHHPMKVDINNLLNNVTKVYANYIFEENIVDSVLLNCHTNTLNKKINENDGILILIDFINYISKINNVDRVFTLKELQEKHQEQKHIKEMEELKSFLKQAYEYYDRLYEEDTIEEIYEEMCTKYELKNISTTGSYNYTDEASKKYGRTQMYPWDKRLAEKELYAMSYAYFKMYGGNKHSLKIKPIKQKINEMKHR